MSMNGILGKGLFAALLALAGGVPVMAQQAFPDGKPIAIAVASQSGGANTVARLVAEKLGVALKVPVVVENRSGPMLAASARHVGDSKPDGHTLLLASSGHSLISAQKNPPYNLASGFTSVTLVARGPVALAARKDIPGKTLAEVIAYAKANPGKLKFGSGGVGTLFHLLGEQLKIEAGIDIVHVPYDASSSALNDLLGGHIDLVFDNLGTIAPHVAAGSLVGLGTPLPKRSDIASGIPTFIEAGMPKFEAGQWYGLFAAPNTPPAITNRIRDEVAAALATPDMVDQFKKLSLEPVAGKPEELDVMIKAEVERWKSIIATAKLEP